MWINPYIKSFSLKVMEWTEGKKKNIRALICSLNNIIWDGCKWNECGMHQLVQPNDVKKMYRKACLAVHPDKVTIRTEVLGTYCLGVLVFGRMTVQTHQSLPSHLID